MQNLFGTLQVGITEKGGINKVYIALTICDQHTGWSRIRTLVKCWSDQHFCQVTNF